MDAAVECYLTYFYGKTTTAKGTYFNAWKITPNSLTNVMTEYETKNSKKRLFLLPLFQVIRDFSFSSQF